MHEYIHAINGDRYRCGILDVTNSAEGKANIQAILLLWKMFLDEDGNFSYFDKFIESTDCPYEQSKLIIEDSYSELNKLSS